MKISSHLIIAGSGRSGTTWVLDVLAKANNLRTIFEPLHPLGVPESQPFANRYVKDDADKPELKRFMKNIFENKISSLWTNYRMLPEDLKPSIKNMTSWDYNYSLLSRYKTFLIRFLKTPRWESQRLITKFIRANLMLGWLANNFNLRIVFLVRHPGAVVASKIALSEGKKGKAAWGFYSQSQQSLLQQYIQDEKLDVDYLYKYKEILKWKLSAVSGFTLMWCIENILPIYKAQQKKLYVVFYEDLLTHPETEFYRVKEVLNLKHVPKKADIIRSSQQASPAMWNKSFDPAYVNRWMTTLTNQQLAEIETILKIFNVTIYSAYEPTPISRIQGHL